MTTAVGGADLRITKSDTPDPVFAGQSLRYDIVVTNDGPAAAFNVTVVDTLPAAVAYQTSTAACYASRPGADLQPGQPGDRRLGSFSIQVLVLPTAATAGPVSITNSAVVSSDQQDPDSSDNTATASTVVNELADLWVTKECKPDRLLAAGQEGICTITVGNAGPSSARAVQVVDEHLSNGTFNFGAVTTTQGTCVADANPQVNDGTVTCNLGTLAAGATVTIKVPVSAATTQDINDTARVSSPTPDPNPANNQASDGVSIRPEADLSVTKSDTPGSRGGRHAAHLCGASHQ